MKQFSKDQLRNLEENIRFVERQFNYTFKNKSLLKQAFYRGVQHTSYCGKYYGITNQNLEYIGDRVLYVAVIMNTHLLSADKISTDGFYIGPSGAEFSKKCMSQTNNIYLCEKMRSKHLKFLKKLLVAPQHPRDNAKAWADLYESIFGAIALDCNFDMNTILRSYLASNTIVQHKGMLNYIKSKKETDQAIKSRYSD